MQGINVARHGEQDHSGQPRASLTFRALPILSSLAQTQVGRSCEHHGHLSLASHVSFLLGGEQTTSASIICGHGLKWDLRNAVVDISNWGSKDRSFRHDIAQQLFTALPMSAVTPELMQRYWSCRPQSDLCATVLSCWNPALLTCCYHAR